MVYKSTVAVPIRRNSHHLALTFSLKEIADFLQLYKPNTHLITPSRKGLKYTPTEKAHTGLCPEKLYVQLSNREFL